VLYGHEVSVITLDTDTHDKIIENLKNTINADSDAKSKGFSAEVKTGGLLTVIGPAYLNTADVYSRYILSSSTDFKVWIPCITDTTTTPYTTDYSVKVYANTVTPSLTVNKNVPVYITWDSFEGAKSCSCVHTYIDNNGDTQEESCGTGVGIGVKASGNPYQGTNIVTNGSQVIVGNNTFDVTCSD